jgi:hypothetical protein
MYGRIGAHRPSCQSLAVRRDGRFSMSRRVNRLIRPNQPEPGHGMRWNVDKRLASLLLLACRFLSQRVILSCLLNQFPCELDLQRKRNCSSTIQGGSRGGSSRPSSILGMSWVLVNESLSDIPVCRDLGLLKRDRNLQKRYDDWSAGIAKEYGSIGKPRALPEFIVLTMYPSQVSSQPSTEVGTA